MYSLLQHPVEHVAGQRCQRSSDDHTQHALCGRTLRCEHVQMQSARSSRRFCRLQPFLERVQAHACERCEGSSKERHRSIDHGGRHTSCRCTCICMHAQKQMSRCSTTILPCTTSLEAYTNAAYAYSDGPAVFSHFCLVHVAKDLTVQ